MIQIRRDDGKGENEMNKVKVFLAGLAFVAGLYAVNYAASSDLRAAQSGEAKLVCLMKDGERTIAPEMVTGLIEDTWLFKNGSSKRCRIER